jgi:hypothetical protein
MDMKTWVKITEGNEEKAIKALEELAVSKDKVCIMTKYLEYDIPDVQQITAPWVKDYYHHLESLSLERCTDFISKSGEATGEFDFYFEWLEEPSKEHLNEFVNDIKATLRPLNVKFQIENK